MAEAKEQSTVELTEKSDIQEKKVTPDISGYQKTHDKVQNLQKQEVYEENFEWMWNILASKIDMWSDDSTEKEIFTKYFERFISWIEGNKSEAVSLYKDIIEDDRLDWNIAYYISVMNFIQENQDSLEDVRFMIDDDFWEFKEYVEVNYNILNKSLEWEEDIIKIKEETKDEVKETKETVSEIMQKWAEAVNKILANFPEKQAELEEKKAQLEATGMKSEEATILAFQQILATDEEFKAVVMRDYAQEMEEYKKAINFTSSKIDLKTTSTETTQATEKLLNSGIQFVEVTIDPEDLGLLVEKVLEIHEDKLRDEIIESEYGMNYETFLEYAETGVPEDKKEQFDRIQNEILMPLVVNFQEMVGSTSNEQLVIQARNGMYQYIQNMFMVPTDDGYIANMMDMNLQDESIDGENGNYSFSNLVKYKWIPMNIGIDGNGDVNMTDYISSEKWSFAIGEDLQVNNLFHGLTINELLASCPQMDMMTMVENAKSMEEINANIASVIQSHIEETLAQRVGDLNNAKIEMGWEMEKQVTLNKFIGAYEPPVHEYRFGSGMEISKDKNREFYDYLKVVDKTAGDASTGEMKEFQRVMSSSEMADLLRISGNEGVGTMDIIEDLNLLKWTITKQLDIRSMKEFSHDLMEGDVDMLNVKYSLEGKEFKKEGWKIYISSKEEGGLVSGFGAKVKKIFG